MNCLNIAKRGQVLSDQYAPIIVQTNFVVEVEGEQRENTNQRTDGKAALPVVGAPQEVLDIVIPRRVHIYPSLPSEIVKRKVLRRFLSQRRKGCPPRRECANTQAGEIYCEFLTAGRSSPEKGKLQWQRLFRSRS